MDPARDLRHAQRLLASELGDERCDLNNEENSMITIIVFSHLRWGFVYQRPQQLLTRLARGYRILFVEEPVYDPSATVFEVHTPIPNIRVLNPHTQVLSPGFSDSQLPLLQQLLQDFLAEEKLGDHIVWFYTPMALPLLQDLRPRAIVYDCMDELSAFKNAPQQLMQRESALLRVANVVFTGGPSL
jgi:UDP-galactopyranose mutase